MCFGCSREPSHRDGSFEYPQHMFWLINKKSNFQLTYTLSSGGLFLDGHIVNFFIVFSACVE